MCSARRRSIERQMHCCAACMARCERCAATHLQFLLGRALVQLRQLRKFGFALYNALAARPKVDTNVLEGHRIRVFYSVMQQAADQHLLHSSCAMTPAHESEAQQVWRNVQDRVCARVTTEPCPARFKRNPALCAQRQCAVWPYISATWRTSSQPISARMRVTSTGCVMKGSPDFRSCP
jgi:hypothetical protein